MPVNALVVDDSASMQQLLKTILESDPEINVVGLASNPMEAREAIKRLNPDVITLDVEMPGMNGIEFLDKIMKLRPMPVVIISSHTQKGTDVSLEALRLGAFCCIAKPRIDDEAAMEEIRHMVKAGGQSMSSYRSRSVPGRQSAAPAQRQTAPWTEPDLIVVGSSTGGVEALTTMFSKFPEDCPPTVVTQHMPANFTKSFANRLDKTYPQTFAEAENNIELKRGHVYIAPGAVGHTTINNNGALRTQVRTGDPVMGHMPAVDYLFASAADAPGLNINAVILTGMGSDGARGMKKLRGTGARTIAQDEATSLVYGMPGAAAKIDAATDILPLNQIADAIFST